MTVTKEPKLSMWAQRRKLRKSEQISSMRYYSSVSDHIYRIFAYAFCIVSVSAVMIPLIFVVAASFSSPRALLSAEVFLWPVDFNIRGYTMVLEHPMLMRSLWNSVQYTAVGTLINVVMTVLAAYPLSRRDLKARNAVMYLFAFTMLFNGGLIPTYMLIRNLGLLNTFWVMVIPGAISVWNLIITRTYFQVAIPSELHESAGLDGCDDFRFLLKIAVPLAAPIIAVNVLLYAVAHWNSFFHALVYLTDNMRFPLQLILREILIQDDITGMAVDIREQLERQETRFLLQYSTIVVSTVPVMLLYPFIQRYFVKGIMVGAIKG